MYNPPIPYTREGYFSQEEEKTMATTTEKQWTIMVYLAGDNNLDSAGVTDLKEMKEIGSTEQVNVTAQFDRWGGTEATKRYYLRKGGVLAKDEVASLGETDMGDPNVLKAISGKALTMLEWACSDDPPGMRTPTLYARSEHIHAPCHVGQPAVAQSITNCRSPPSGS